MKPASLIVWTLSLALIAFWFAGMSASSTFGGFLHLLLIPAMVAAYVELGRTARTTKVTVL